MQQFTVPQFIDVEDKIIGPITVRQFIIMLVAVLLIAGAYKLFDFMLFLTFAIPVFGIACIIAFVKINGAAFHYFLLNIVQTLKKPRLRVWRKDDTLGAALEIENPAPVAAVPERHRYSASRLNELSLIVDTQGSYQGESDESVVITRRSGLSDFS